MDRTPLKHLLGCGSRVVILVMAIAIMVDRGEVNGLSLDEACTKLRANSADLNLQGFTSDGTYFTLVVNDQMFTIPQKDEYLNNTNPKLALFSRGEDGQIKSKSPIMSTTGFFAAEFDGTVPIRNPAIYSLMLFHYVSYGKKNEASLYNAMFRKTDLTSDAPNWTFTDQESLRSVESPLYGFVSDTQEDLKRSFVLRPFKKNDHESKIAMSIGDSMFYLDFDLKILTIRPVTSDGSDDEATEKEHQSLVTMLPMVGFIYGDKVHLWNTYSGQVFVYDYHNPSEGASVEVSAYPFDQYFACNEDQWNSISQTVNPVVNGSSIQGLSKGNGFGAIGVVGGIIAVIVIALMAFLLYKRGGPAMSKSKVAENIKSVKPMDRAKSATKNASKAIGSIAGKTVASARNAFSAATSSAQSSAASTLSKASSGISSSASSSASSRRGGSNAGSSMGSSAGSTLSVASSA